MSCSYTDFGSFEIHRGAKRDLCFSFAESLLSGVTLSSGASVTERNTDDLTIASVTINGSTFTDVSDSTTVAASKGVTARITAPEEPETYFVDVEAVGSDGQTFGGYARIVVT